MKVIQMATFMLVLNIFVVEFLHSLHGVVCR